MDETKISISPSVKTPAPQNPDIWSKKPAILIWSLLTTNLLLLIVVVRVTSTNRERHDKHDEHEVADYLTDYSPHNEVTASHPLNVTAGLCRPCSPRWIWIENKCYFFSENKKTRDDSDRICRQMGGRLAIVKEGLILRLATIMSQEFWVGLAASGTHYQEDSWIGVWADDSTTSIREGSGTCAKLGPRLSLENCYRDLYWICEKKVNVN
ncbi:CD209 antigen-like protein 2 [Dendropsophus ebraccatus]|uniref:CD209 antigen-like protein 2 n=1 Tax=Dendropsophus ebraccatus TaxID=150705 RepID=UPI003831C646